MSTSIFDDHLQFSTTNDTGPDDMNSEHKKYDMNNSGLTGCLISGMCILTVGSYLHAKIVQTSVKEKGVTWKLDCANSCIVITHHIQCLIMEFVSYLIQDLHQYTGKWICYSSKVVSYYGNIHCVGHSTIIAFMKYTLIVNWEKVLEIGDEKIKNRFFWANIFYSPVYMLLILCIEPDFFWDYGGLTRVDRCLGDPENNWGVKTNITQKASYEICHQIIQHQLRPTLESILQYCRAFACWSHVVFLYLTVWNVFEIVLYVRIFAFMRR